eukprot:TRINITY_DN25734_c0_g3_i4.p1 TRINITY_DN25734_c0_g3~~TRINITY_DN25734_c0_g3_i4.p1  ORF type:complete len:308 (-),score=54.73 TRINITY_DN25734_c0_g3_i4:185-1060(-)
MREREIEKQREKERERERQLEQEREEEREREKEEAKRREDEWGREREQLHDEVQSIHDALLEARRELNAQRESSGERVKQLARELEEAKARVEVLTEDNTRMAAAVSKMEAEVGEATNERDAFKLALEHSNLEHKLLANALKSNGSHAIENLHGELSAAQASVRALQSTVDLLQQQLRKEAAESASLMEELTDLKSLRLSEVAQHKEQISRLQATLSSLRHTCEREKDERFRLKKALDEADRSAHELATDAERMSAHAQRVLQMAAAQRERLIRAVGAGKGASSADSNSSA